jgi:hypothetical protein
VSAAASTGADFGVRVRLACPRCEGPMEVSALMPGAATMCFACRTAVHVLVFPRALAYRSSGEAGPPSQPEQARCYFHEERTAEAPCQACGRFVCQLCQVEIEGRRLCPECFNRRADDGSLLSMRTREVRHDSLAAQLGWVWIPFVTFLIPLPVCAISVLYLTIRYYKEPSRSVIPRRPWRFWLGIAGGVVAPLAGAVWIAYIIAAVRRP